MAVCVCVCVCVGGGGGGGGGGEARKTTSFLSNHCFLFLIRPSHASHLSLEHLFDQAV